jgi:tetratricopeptide (TPR) repeat protein
LGAELYFDPQQAVDRKAAAGCSSPKEEKSNARSLSRQIARRIDRNSLSDSIMNEIQTQHDRLWKLIDAAQAASDHETANTLFREAEQFAGRLHEVEPDDAEHCYAIALTFYHRWDTQHERQKCVEWLRKTEERDPTHPWVPLYLGYQFFDEKRYADAYAEFNRVNQDYFTSRHLEWRNIKTDELKIVALILSGSTQVDFSMLVRLADRYTAAEAIDRPIPTEIVNALVDSKNRERFTEPKERVASEVCRVIRACGDTNIFPDQLASLGDTALG